MFEFDSQRDFERDDRAAMDQFSTAALTRREEHIARDQRFDEAVADQSSPFKGASHQ
jgi:hypothetical protein